MSHIVAAGSGSITLILLGAVIWGYRKGETFTRYPLRVALIFAPFLTLIADPFLPDTWAANTARAIGGLLFVFLVLATVAGSKDADSGEMSTGDYITTTLFLAVSMFGAVWLLGGLVV